MSNEHTRNNLKCKPKRDCARKWNKQIKSRNRLLSFPLVGSAMCRHVWLSTNRLAESVGRTDSNRENAKSGFHLRIGLVRLVEPIQLGKGKIRLLFLVQVSVQIRSESFEPVRDQQNGKSGFTVPGSAIGSNPVQIGNGMLSWFSWKIFKIRAYCLWFKYRFKSENGTLNRSSWENGKSGFTVPGSTIGSNPVRIVI